MVALSFNVAMALVICMLAGPAATYSGRATSSLQGGAGICNGPTCAQVYDDEVVSLLQLRQPELTATGVMEQATDVDDENPNMGPYSFGVSWKEWYDDMDRRFPPSDRDWKGFDTSNYGLATYPLHKCAADVPAGQSGHHWPFNATAGTNMYATLADKSPTSLTDAEVLEISSGRGGGAALLSDCFCPSKMVGLDFSEKQVERARSRFGRDGRCPIQFVQGDAMRLPFKDASFDVVLNVEASHGYSSYRNFITEAHRVLRPGGTFLTADFRTLPGAQMDTAIMESVFAQPVFPMDVTHMVIRSFEENKLIEPFVAFCNASYKANPPDYSAGCANFAGVSLAGLPALSSGMWNYRMYVLQKDTAKADSKTYSGKADSRTHSGKAHAAKRIVAETAYYNN